MGKLVHDDVLDGALNIIKNNATIITVCNAQPTTRTEAITTFKLADDTVASTDFTVANGDTSGRKITVAQRSNVPIDTSGTATHVAICDGTRLLLVTTCTSQPLTAGGTVTIPAFDDEIADPT